MKLFHIVGIISQQNICSVLISRQVEGKGLSNVFLKLFFIIQLSGRRKSSPL